MRGPSPFRDDDADSFGGFSDGDGDADEKKPDADADGAADGADGGGPSDDVVMKEEEGDGEAAMKMLGDVLLGAAGVAAGTAAAAGVDGDDDGAPAAEVPTPGRGGEPPDGAAFVERRACAFCGGGGGAAAAVCGRLIPVAADKWAHANCALWCNEVVEKEPGVLVNVRQALRRAAKTACAWCAQYGASVTCGHRTCHQAYHYACAREAKVKASEAFKSATWCCDHLPQRKPPVPLPAGVARSLRVRQPSKLHEDDASAYPSRGGGGRRQRRRRRRRAEALPPCGALRLLRLGRPQPTKPQFHDRHQIYPLGYLALRRFHDVLAPRRRVDYACEVREADGLPTFVIAHRRNRALTFTGRTPAEAWGQLMKSWYHALAADGRAGAKVAMPSVTARRAKLESALFFGFGAPAVAQLIEQLPHAKACEGFTPRYSTPDASQKAPPLPLSASGCARTDGRIIRSSNYKHHHSMHYRPFINRGALPDFMGTEGGLAQVGRTRETAAEAWGGLHELDRPGLRNARPEQKGMVITVGTCEQKGLPRSCMYVAVRRSAIHNWGLFTTRPLPRDAMVVEYMGQGIRNPVADLREKRYEEGVLGGQGGDCYMFRLDADVVLDATQIGNIARYINHCCTPNCYSKVVEVAGKKHIVIFAARDLGEGEEVTYDYKFQVEAKKIACHCGSPKCLGVMN